MDHKQQSAMPTTKVLSGSLAGALGTLIVFLWVRIYQEPLDPMVASALVTALMAVVAYFVPLREVDAVVKRETQDTT